MTFRSRIPKIITPRGGFLQPLLDYQDRKMKMDVKDKKRAVIECFLFKGGAGEKIVIRLRNMYGSEAYCRGSVFRWISEVRRGNDKI
jgi:hypothetical protein